MFLDFTLFLSVPLCLSFSFAHPPTLVFPGTSPLSSSQRSSVNRADDYFSTQLSASVSLHDAHSVPYIGQRSWALGLAKASDGHRRKLVERGRQRHREDKLRVVRYTA